ncbi:hypothetical protein CTA2_6179, partial [Colletotrichum tanaceti]
MEGRRPTIKITEPERPKEPERKPERSVKDEIAEEAEVIIGRTIFSLRAAQAQENRPDAPAKIPLAKRRMTRPAARQALWIMVLAEPEARDISSIVTVSYVSACGKSVQTMIAEFYTAVLTHEFAVIKQGKTVTTTFTPKQAFDITNLFFSHFMRETVVHQRPLPINLSTAVIRLRHILAGFKSYSKEGPRARYNIYMFGKTWHEFRDILEKDSTGNVAHRQSVDEHDEVAGWFKDAALPYAICQAWGIGGIMFMPSSKSNHRSIVQFSSALPQAIEVVEKHDEGMFHHLAETMEHMVIDKIQAKQPIMAAYTRSGKTPSIEALLLSVGAEANIVYWSPYAAPERRPRGLRGLGINPVPGRMGLMVTLTCPGAWNHWAAAAVTAGGGGPGRRVELDARLIGKDPVTYDSPPRPDVSPATRVHDALRGHQRHLLTELSKRSTTVVETRASGGGGKEDGTSRKATAAKNYIVSYTGFRTRPKFALLTTPAVAASFPSQSLHRFRFAIKGAEDLSFNHEVIVDVISSRLPSLAQYTGSDDSINGKTNKKLLRKVYAIYRSKTRTKSRSEFRVPSITREQVSFYYRCNVFRDPLPRKKYFAPYIQTPKPLRVKSRVLA